LGSGYGIDAQQAKPGASTVVANYTTKSGIVYTQGANGPLKADAYTPHGDGPFPGIVFIHGGGWMNGDRYQMVKLIKELANHGYVGFTIDYDLDPVPYPTALHESFAGVRYFREHAAEFHLDPARVAVAGSSAGGELAALIALNSQDTSGKSTDANESVRAAVILNGVLDLMQLGDNSSMVTKYLGKPCSEAPDACRDASPSMHVHAGAPPFFVGHGTADTTVPYSQAEAFVAKLRENKVPVRFFTAQGGPHTYWMKEQFFPQNLADLQQFLALALGERRRAL
jgi:acetyl esterase/lipase